VKHRFILATVALFLGVAAVSSATPASAVSQSVKYTFQVSSKGEALPAQTKGAKGGIYPADVWCGNGTTFRLADLHPRGDHQEGSDRVREGVGPR
jgi:hypothetical protein